MCLSGVMERFGQFGCAKHVRDALGLYAIVASPISARAARCDRQTGDLI
jgi:hypothetical protein